MLTNIEMYKSCNPQKILLCFPNRFFRKNRHAFVLILTAGAFLLVSAFGRLSAATIVNQRIGSIDMTRLLKDNPAADEIRESLSADINKRHENIKFFQSKIEELEQEIEKMGTELKNYTELSKAAAEKAGQVAASTDAVTSISSGTVAEVSSSSGIAAHISQPAESTESHVEAVHQQQEPETKEQTGTINISSPSFTAQDIETKKQELETQQKALEEYIRDTAKAEKSIDAKVKHNLLGKIYDTIKDIVEEEGLTVVLDSSYIIYDDNVQDITDKVIRKLIGR